jgi:hypothetical protein
VSRLRRIALTALVVVATLAASGLVGYRVLAPAETLTLAAGPYPAAVPPRLGVRGQLPRVPLIVDGGLRVYAARRQVWADGPVGSRTETTPFWSLRRWPEQVLAVVVTPGPRVVSQWSDGRLVGTDARTGQTVWRAGGPVDAAARYPGRRTGAAAVYRPERLYSAGRTVVAAAGAQASGYDAATGALLWTVRLPGCRASAFTAPAFFAVLDTCPVVPVLRRFELRSGSPLPDWRPPDAGAGWRIEPVSCAVGRSSCPAARTRGAGWMFAGTDVLPAPGLTPPGSWLVEGVAVGPDGVARSPATAAPQWTWTLAARYPAAAPRIVAVGPAAIYLLSGDRELVVVDPASGLELTRFPLTWPDSPAAWTPGAVYARDGYVVVERLADPAAHTDNRYYLGLRPVLIAGA